MYLTLHANPFKVEKFVLSKDNSIQNNSLKYCQLLKKHLIYDNEMSTVTDKNLDSIGLKEREYQTLFRADENDHRKIKKKKRKSSIFRKFVL